MGYPLKIGVALGGGGARGLAHVGVLKVLEEARIPIHYIAGTSIGAIVGAMYAQHPDADYLIERFKSSLDDEFYEQLGIDYLKTDGAKNGSILHQLTSRIKRRLIINLAQSRKALLKDIRLFTILQKFIAPGKIEDCQIPLTVLATSLNTGKDYPFDSGDIITAVAASCAIPGFIEPVFVDNDILTDGGVSCPVPVDYVRKMGADIVLAVEVGIREINPLDELNVIEIIARADQIMSQKIALEQALKADLALFPATGDVHWSEFQMADHLIEAGITEARQKLPRLQSIIRSRLPWYRRIFPART